MVVCIINLKLIMAKLKYINSKLTNSPIKSLNQLNLILDGNIGNNTTIITQNSSTLSGKFKVKGKTIKLTYKGKFNYSTQAKWLQSSIKSGYIYINNKLDGYLVGVNYKVGDSYNAVSSVKSANKLMSKIFKKNDTILGGKGNDNLWGYLGNDKISGGAGNDILCGGLGNDKLIGGKGKDIFKLSKGKGYDLIQDFKNKQDKIFVGSMKKLKLKNKGKDVLVFQGKDLLAKVKKAKGLLSKKGGYLV